MLDICKLTAALVFAAIAGLTVIAVGLMSEVRIAVILMRTAGIFIVTGVLVYIGAFLFERLGYDRLIKDAESGLADIKAQEQAEAMAEQKKAADASLEMVESAGNENEVPGDGFAPLNTDSLRRVTGSAEG